MHGNSTRRLVVASGGDHVVGHVGLHALGAFADRLELGNTLSSDQALKPLEPHEPRHPLTVVGLSECRILRRCDLIVISNFRFFFVSSRPLRPLFLSREHFLLRGEP
jgi:inactivated superfamily I helicase